MTRATKGALAVGALALALLVALLPRVGGPGEGGAREGPSEDSRLARARARADLPPCPAAGTGGTEATGSARGAPASERPEVPRLAGVSTLCLGDGSPVHLGRALSGEVTLINVWATWCEPCRAELPLLDSYAAEPGAAQVLLVQVQSSRADGLDRLADLGVRLPSVHDGKGVRGPVRAALRVPPVLPASYLVDADGDVRLVTEPRLFTSTEQIREVVERAR